MVLLHKYNIFLFYIYLLIGYVFDVTDHVVCNIVICILKSWFRFVGNAMACKRMGIFTWFGKLHTMIFFHFYLLIDIF